MTSNKNKERWETGFFSDTDLNVLKEAVFPHNIGSLYIKVDVFTLSEVREKLVNANYTTRLFVARVGSVNHFFIYGKKKANKGVFNEHCKNTVHHYEKMEDVYTHIIDISSNEHQKVITDNDDCKSIIQFKNRIPVELNDEQS